MSPREAACTRYYSIGGLSDPIVVEHSAFWFGTAIAAVGYAGFGLLARPQSAHSRHCMTPAVRCQHVLRRKAMPEVVMRCVAMILMLVFVSAASAWPWSEPTPDEKQAEAILLSLCPLRLPRLPLPPGQPDLLMPSHGRVMQVGHGVVRWCSAGMHLITVARATTVTSTRKPGQCGSKSQAGGREIHNRDPVVASFDCVHVT